MSESFAQTLSARLDRFERSNRSWRHGFLVALTLLVVIGLAGAQGRNAATTIEAQEIVVLDRNGKPRISLKVGDRGPIIAFTSEDGHPRLLMGTGGGPFQNDAPFLNFRSKDGMPRLLMGMSEDPFSSESPFINLCGKRGFTRLRMDLNPDDGAEFEITAGRDRPVLFLGSDPQEGSYLILKDLNGNDVFGWPLRRPSGVKPRPEENKEKKGG